MKEKNKQSSDVTLFYIFSTQEVARTFDTSIEHGLSKESVKTQRNMHGWNEVHKRDLRIFRVLLGRLFSILNIILISAAGISLYFQHFTDAIIIFFALLFDIIFGLIYEVNAYPKINLIKKKVPRLTEVIRNGTSYEILVRELVPGDICTLRAGERVPADIRLVSVRGLRIDESILTGEPGDVEKVHLPLQAEAALGDQRNMAFTGTLVTSGSARGIVVATGPETVLGTLADRVRAAGQQGTPLERRLRIFGGILGGALIVASALIFLAGVLRGETPQFMLRQALTLVVSAIPEGLTLILTLTLVIGARRLLTRGGVVRHLAAAETLGDATIICTDKTGTITTGEITLARVEGIHDAWTMKEWSLRAGRRQELPDLESVRQTLVMALAGTDTVHVVRGGVSAHGSSLERALGNAALTLGVDPGKIRREYPLLDTLAFDPVNRFRASLHVDPAHPEPIVFVVGAPDTLIPRCSSASADRQGIRLGQPQRIHLMERAEYLAGQGHHVLAVALRYLPRTQRAITTGDIQHLAFKGLLVFHDPPRSDAALAVAGLTEAGVRVLLLTGDHRGTAVSIGRTVGILRPGTRTLEGKDVVTMSDTQLAAALRTTTVLARLDPLQKERVVQLLQRQGEIVGMVGDGVNDAVALRRADLGVAVGSATDVAKDASDLVLVDRSIATLAAAVHEGRRVRETVRTVLLFLFSTNVTEVFALVAALLLGWPFPLLPAMLLWINIVTDGTADLALALEPADTRPGDAVPGRRQSIFRAQDLVVILFSAVSILIPTMLMYGFALHATGAVATAQTVAFITLATAQLFAAFSYRSLDRSLASLPPFGNLWLIAAVIFSFALLIAAVLFPPLQTLLGTVPLSPSYWFLAVSAGFLGALGVELRKYLLPTSRLRSSRRYALSALPRPQSLTNHG